jgi:hypothetical protein
MATSSACGESFITVDVVLWVDAVWPLRKAKTPLSASGRECHHRAERWEGSRALGPDVAMTVPVISRQR